DELRPCPRRVHVDRYLERQPPYLARSGDLRHGLARGAPRDRPVVVTGEHRRGRFAPRRDQPCAVPAEHVTREDLGIERRFVWRNTRRDQPRARAGEMVVQHGHHAEASVAVASLSFSEVKWLTAASISSPRSPSSAAARWCIV